MSRRTPRLPKPSQDRQGDHIADFRSNLQKIAIRLAWHQKSTFVDVPHVDEAFNVLCRIGISRQPWWKKPEFDTTVSGILFAIALATPDMMPVLLDFFENRWLSEHNPTGTTVLVSAVLGAFFLGKGWIKSLRPS